MKTTAEIRWCVDVPEFNIAKGKHEGINVDLDYIEDSLDLNEAVVFELGATYSKSFVAGTDFRILNENDILDDLACNSFSDKTQYSVLQ